MPRPAEMPSDQPEAERRGPKAGLSPSHCSTTSSVGKIPSPIRGPYPQTSDDDATLDVGLVDPSSHRKGKRSHGNKGDRSGESSDSSHFARSSTSRGGRRKKKDGFSNKIPYPGVKAVLDNAITPLTERAEQGVRPNPDNQKVGPEVTVGVRPARLATTNITNWKLEQQEDPVLYQVVKHRKASQENFKEALLKVTDRKAVSAYVKSKDQLFIRSGLLYRQSKQGQTQETVLQFIVPQIHRNAALDRCHREAAHQG